MLDLLGVDGMLDVRDIDQEAGDCLQIGKILLHKYAEVTNVRLWNIDHVVRFDHYGRRHVADARSRQMSRPPIGLPYMSLDIRMTLVKSAVSVL